MLGYDGSRVIAMDEDEDDVLHDKSLTQIWCEDYEREGLPVLWFGDFLLLSELRQRCERENQPLPGWVWAAEALGFLLNAEEVLGGARDRNEQPVRDLIPHEEVDRLQELLDGWSTALDLKSYEVDYERIVILDRSLLNT
jgi:hypothetical protein